MHASQRCITLRDPQVVLVSSRGFESRLSVAVAVWLWICALVTSSASSRSLTAKTVQHTLDTADETLGPCQLGDLLDGPWSLTEFSSATC